MKNLKRILSLALASTMLVGMMVVGAGAATFTDTEGNAHTTAIEVMTGLGVINGRGNGQFDPNGTVSRAEMAKLISVSLMGKEFNFGTKDTPTFTDIKGHWAENYIEYCANFGYINGRGDGTFEPNGKVTSTEAARMILNALGLKDGATGNNWALNTEIDANNIGLYNALDKEITDPTRTPMTRAQAAQMLFNGINYSKDGETTAYIVKDSAKNVIYEGTDPIVALLMKNEKAGNTLERGTTNAGSIADKVFNMEKVEKDDDFGRSSTVYYNTKTDKVYASFGSKAALTYTTAVTPSKIYNDLGLTKTVAAANVKWFIDGYSNRDDNGTVKADMTLAIAKSDTSTVIGGRGTTTEVYYDGQTVTVVQVATYVGKITKVNKAQAATATQDAKKASVEVELLRTDYTHDSADKTDRIASYTYTYETENYKVGDIVLVTAVNEHKGSSMIIKSMVKAPAVAGVVTAHFTTGYFRVNGEQKFLSEKNGNDAGIGAEAAYKYDNATANQTYIYYLDTCGNVIYAVKDDGTTEITDYDYYWVIDVAAKEAVKNPGQLFDAQVITPAVAQAKVLNMRTGKVSTENIAIVEKNGEYYYADFTGKATTTPVTTLLAGNENKAVTSGDVATEDAADTKSGKVWASVKLEDGSIVLHEALTVRSGLTLKKGDANIGLVDGNDIIGWASPATQVNIYEYDDKGNWTTIGYNGINNFPTNEELATAVVVYGKSGLLSDVFVVRKAQSKTATATYAIYAGIGETSKDGVAYKFYVNGEAKNYYAASELTDLAEGKVYTLTFTDGKITNKTEVSPFVSTDATHKVSAVEDSFFVIETKTTVNGKDSYTYTVHYFADGCVIVDEGADYALADLAAGDEMKYHEVTINGAKYVDLIIIAE